MHVTSVELSFVVDMSRYRLSMLTMITMILHLDSMLVDKILVYQIFLLRYRRA